MIIYKTGDIFTSKSQCLVNPVNCVGVMGAGLALEFKRRFPGMFSMYKKACDDGKFGLGQVIFYSSTDLKSPIICMFPTKFHWRNHSTLETIDKGLQAFIKYAPKMEITSAAFPKIGCGLGGLNFEYHVQPLFERYFKDNTTFTIEVYT